MKTYTDYPIIELGDHESFKAPLRECEVIAYDGDMLLYIKVENILKNVKRSFVYTTEGRFTEVESITDEEIINLVKTDQMKELEDTYEKVKHNKIGWREEIMINDKKYLVFVRPDDEVSGIEVVFRELIS